MKVRGQVGGRWVDGGWQNDGCLLWLDAIKSHWDALKPGDSWVMQEIAENCLLLVTFKVFLPVFSLKTTIDNTLSNNNNSDKSSQQQILHSVIFWGIGEWQSTHLVNVAYFIVFCCLFVSCWMHRTALLPKWCIFEIPAQMHILFVRTAFRF